MTDHAVLWTRSERLPRKLADITLADGIPLPLRALIPPRHTGNIQRKLQLLHIERLGIELRGRPLIEQDWLSLVHFGHGGIGVLDVFKDDQAAADYYAGPQQQHGLADLPALLRFTHGRATPADMDRVLAVPVAGVSGMQPKLVLDDWIVKVDAPGFPGLLQLEALAYRVHRRAGCEVPEVKLADIDGEQVLISWRFDRRDGARIPMESVYSLMATRSPGQVRHNTDASAEDVLVLLQELTGEPQQEAYRRFVLSLLTGNGDLHLENLAVLGAGEEARLSPLYDPAPMRAYRGRPSYDLLSALPFTGIGGVQPATGSREYAESGETPPDLRARVLKLGDAAGLTRRQTKAVLARCLKATEGYAEAAVAELRKAVPGYAGRAPDIKGFERTLRDIQAVME